MIVLCLGIFFLLVIFKIFQSSLEAVSSAAKFGCGGLLVLGIIGMLMEPFAGSNTSTSESAAGAVGLLLLGLGFLVWVFSRDSGKGNSLNRPASRRLPERDSSNSSNGANTVENNTTKEADRGLANVAFWSKHTLPGLASPAGYICVVRQPDVTDMYRFVSTKSPQTMGFGVELPVKSSIAHMFRSHDTDSTMQQIRQHFAHRRRSPDQANDPGRSLLNRLFSPQEELYELSVEDLQEMHAMGERLKPIKAKQLYENINTPSSTSINWKNISTWAVLLILTLVLASLAWDRLAPAFLTLGTNSWLSTETVAEANKPLAVTATKADTSKTYKVLTDGETPARVRSCPRTTCQIIGRLSPGTKVRSIREVEGMPVNGSVKWIEVEHEGARGYIHGSLLK
ncbi:MAG: SH3 domain-containing protein [Chloroflexota bacterium]|nr:SH3 domain-containing protein [Chloroflexota bacterium]